MAPIAWSRVTPFRGKVKLMRIKSTSPQGMPLYYPEQRLNYAIIKRINPDSDQRNEY